MTSKTEQTHVVENSCFSSNEHPEVAIMFIMSDEPAISDLKVLLRENVLCSTVDRGVQHLLSGGTTLQRYILRYFARWAHYFVNEHWKFHFQASQILRAHQLHRN
jgi:hypothetical protein